MDGWIKLHRKLLSWEWYQDGNTLRLFLHLLLQANHAPTKWRGEVIEQGQVLTGRHLLSEQTGITEQSIRSSIFNLKSTNEITTKQTNRFTVITIVKYREYQINDKKSTNTPTSNLTNNQPTSNHIQELKKNKNIKKEDKDCVHFQEFYITYPRHEAKQDALKAWTTLKPDEALRSIILAAIEAAKKSEGWLKDGGKYIPLPASWIRGKRWEDEHKEHTRIRGTTKTAGNWARLEERERVRQEVLKNEPKKLTEG